jgi:hypothetical protein
MIQFRSLNLIYIIFILKINKQIKISLYNSLENSKYINILQIKKVQLNWTFHRT